jgi:hypothetical protein
MGAEAGLTWLLALLAEALEREGQLADGYRVLTEALDTVDKRGERVYEAELYRLKGEWTLQQESQKAKGKSQKLAAAEECFLKAIEVAQKQQAKSWELRDAMSLVRLRQHQTREHAPRITHHEARTRLEEARSRLSNVYHWFTEGFDTEDLQEAKALLATFT